jgi:hypothetical protein
MREQGCKNVSGEQQLEIRSVTFHQEAPACVGRAS